MDMIKLKNLRGSAEHAIQQIDKTRQSNFSLNLNVKQFNSIYQHKKKLFFSVRVINPWNSLPDYKIYKHIQETKTI